MASTKTFSSRCTLYAALGLGLVGLMTSPKLVKAQAEGNNAVYNSAGSSVTFSSAFADASAFCGSGGCAGKDFCSVVNTALSTVVARNQTLVVDARGINAGGTNTCSGSPLFSGITNASTVLLPAGTIKISSTWTLPGGTRLLGDGQSQTTILNNGVSTSMISMCSSTCNGVSVEDLTLDGGAGNAANFAGVLNFFAQELSYVKNVKLYRILGAGIRVAAGSSGSASNSGPYSNIKFDTGGLATLSTQTHCVDIEGVATRGFHGLTCLSESTTKPNAGILLNGSNNTLEDVHVDGFLDGIKVGSLAVARGNVLFNINGSDASHVSPNSVIRITNSATAGVVNVRDLVILGATNFSTSTLKTVEDDLTSTSLSDASLAMYTLGEPVMNSLGTSTIGYSRFTSSPNTTTWAVGGSAPTTTTACMTGSMFSVTGSAPNWYVCTGTGTSATWSHIP
jgi:hypothetical protein